MGKEVHFLAGLYHNCLPIKMNKHCAKILCFISVTKGDLSACQTAGVFWLFINNKPACETKLITHDDSSCVKRSVSGFALAIYCTVIIQTFKATTFFVHEDVTNGHLI